MQNFVLSDMHGQALPSVYVNGPNAHEIAFFMIARRS